MAGTAPLREPATRIAVEVTFLRMDAPLAPPASLELRSAQGKLLPVVAEIRSVAREAASARALLLVQAEGSTVPQIRSQKVK
jgi:hypothetical protein